MVKRSPFTTPISVFFLLHIFIMAVFQVEASLPMKMFQFVAEKKNWTNAQQYCIEHFNGLASGNVTDLLNEMKRLKVKKKTWIGLYREPGDDSVWRWTGERGDLSTDTKWPRGDPEKSEHCGFLYEGKLLSDQCSKARAFMCNNLILVKANKTWEEALEHCRAMGSVDASQLNHHHHHQYDLVSLQSDDDHRYARDKIQEATTNEVWTALRFLAGQWLWVDGEAQRYQDLPLCPVWGRHCGTLPKDDSSTPWQIRDCMERRNFLCIKSPQ